MYVLQDYEFTPVRKLIITLAPTGMLPTRKETPYVPITPEEIAKDAYEAYKLGASIIHVHARDEQGKPTCKKAVFEEIFKRIRSKCPDIIICATTSGRVASNRGLGSATGNGQSHSWVFEFSTTRQR
jgi:uncharacterized protein (DUF849 family)